jgi:hypothetical protein
MNDTEEFDDETALFMREMREEARQRQNAIVHALRHNLPHETRIDSVSLRCLLQRHNQAVAMLREFLAIHPEDSDLVNRARQLVDNPE